MAYSPVPSLVSFAPLTTILSADVNSNLAAIRNVVNGVVVGTNTIAADTITEVTGGTGVTVNKKLTITSSGFAVNAGVASFASGIAVTGGGVTVPVGGLAISGGPISIAGGAGLTVTGGVAITGGGLTVSGTTTFASGWSVSGGTINVSGATVSGVATFVSGVNVSAGNVLLTTTGAQSIGFNNDIGTGLTSTSPGQVQVQASNTSVLTMTSSAIALGGQRLTPAPATMATTATGGYIYISTTPGTQSGVPTTVTGIAAICYDTTNNRLQIYNGGWKTVLLA